MRVMEQFLGVKSFLISEISCFVKLSAEKIYAYIIILYFHPVHLRSRVFILFRTGHPPRKGKFS